MKKLLVLTLILLLSSSIAVAKSILTISDEVSVSEHLSPKLAQATYKRQFITDGLGNKYIFVIRPDSHEPILFAKKLKSGEMQWINEIDVSSDILSAGLQVKEQDKKLSNLEADTTGVSFKSISKPNSRLTTLSPYYIDGAFKFNPNGYVTGTMHFFGQFPYEIAADFRVNKQRYFIIRNQSGPPFYSDSENILYVLQDNKLVFVSYLIKSIPNIYPSLKVDNTKVVINFIQQQVILNTTDNTIEMEGFWGNFARKWHNYFWRLKEDGGSIPLKKKSIKVKRINNSPELEKIINPPATSTAKPKSLMLTRNYTLGRVEKIEKDKEGNKYVFIKNIKIINGTSFSPGDYALIKIAPNNTLDWLKDISKMGGATFKNVEFNMVNNIPVISFDQINSCKRNFYPDNHIEINSDGSHGDWNYLDAPYDIDGSGDWLYFVSFFTYKKQEYFIMSGKSKKYAKNYYLYKKEGTTINKIAFITSNTLDSTPIIQGNKNDFVININGATFTYNPSQAKTSTNQAINLRSFKGFLWDNCLYSLDENARGTKVQFK